MVGVVLAVTAGIVALMGLTGRITVPRTWMHTVAAGLPVAAISGAFFAAEGWNLALAIGMTLAVVLGMLASMVGPAELSSPRVTGSRRRGGCCRCWWWPWCSARW